MPKSILMSVTQETADRSSIDIPNIRCMLMRASTQSGFGGGAAAGESTVHQQWLNVSYPLSTLTVAPPSCTMR
jgi:hypothetical protein